MPAGADERRAASPPSKFIDSALWNSLSEQTLLIVPVTVIKYKKLKIAERNRGHPGLCGGWL
jgi:hypothetical protein